MGRDFGLFSGTEADRMHILAALMMGAAVALLPLLRRQVRPPLPARRGAATAATRCL
ncbi:MAG: hypothetical protein IT561_27685 [Alphaproteobacteria bacterium]|nr:hypothetical protein [Alphaproteobacteria bacterium]